MRRRAVSRLAPQVPRLTLAQTRRVVCTTVWQSACLLGHASLNRMVAVTRAFPRRQALRFASCCPHCLRYRDVALPLIQRRGGSGSRNRRLSRRGRSLCPSLPPRCHPRLRNGLGGRCSRANVFLLVMAPARSFVRFSPEKKSLLLLPCCACFSLADDRGCSGHGSSSPPAARLRPST